MRRRYQAVFGYIKSNCLWCWITLLLIAEMILFTCLNTEPNYSYGQYVEETVVKYSGLFPFIFWENLKSALLLIALGTMPFFLGTFYGAYMTITNLVATYKWVLPEVGARKLILCTLSHGIFEITAICFSIILSVLWCRVIMVALVRMIRFELAIPLILENCMSILKSIVFIQLPLLLISGILEVTVSQWIANMVL